jgi:DNA-damage-inducible protein J
MTRSAIVRARLEPSLKTEVEAILSQLGLSASEAIHILYRQIKLRKGLPFEVRIPNELTARTLRRSKAGRNVKRFATKRALFRDLGL